MMDKLKQCAQSRWLVVLGGFLIHFTIGITGTYGNLIPYLASYMHQYVYFGITTASLFWLQGIFNLGQGVLMVFGGFMEERITGRALAAIGSLCITFGLALTSLTVQHSTLLLILTHGLIVGFGGAFAYLAPISLAMKWFPDKRGLAGGMVIAGSGAGNVVFNQLETLFVNPDNVRADHRGFFDDEDLLNRVPHLFLLLAIVTAILQFIGIVLLREPNEPAGKMPKRYDNPDSLESSVCSSRRNSVLTDSIKLSLDYLNRSVTEDDLFDQHFNDAPSNRTDRRRKFSSISAVTPTPFYEDFELHPKQPHPKMADIGKSFSAVDVHTYNKWNYKKNISTNYHSLTASLKSVDDASKVQLDESTPLLDSSSNDKLNSTSSDACSCISTEWTLKLLLRTKEFYILWLTRFFNVSCTTFIASAYKTYGQTFIADDLYLASTGAIGALFVFLGKLLWGLIADRFKYRSLMLFLCGTMAFLLATWVFMPYMGKAGMMVWMVLLSVDYSGSNTLIPATTARTFGAKHVTFVFGLICTSGIVPAVPMIIQGLYPFIGWLGLILIFATMYACSFVLTLLYRETPDLCPIHGDMST